MVGAVMSVDIKEAKALISSLRNNECFEAVNGPIQEEALLLALCAELEAARARVVELKAQHVAFVNDLREAIK